MAVRGETDSFVETEEAVDREEKQRERAAEVKYCAPPPSLTSQ